jgi:predicted DNA-binding transcriptional regulator AlpA
MSDNSPPTGGPFLPSKKVWERYGMTDRTLDRWVADPAMGFPQPLLINKRRYFSEAELVAWERRRAAGRAA